MAEVTRRLKLKIPSGASSDSRYNLQRIDDWAGALQLAEDGSLTIAVRDSLSLVPNARSAGGSGSGGVLNFGTSENGVAVTFYSSSLNFESPIQLKDQASGGTNYLAVKYDSGTADGTNRSLSLDVQGGDRVVTLGGNLTTSGDLTVSGAYSVQLTFTAATSVTFPVSGLLLTDSSTATLTNKAIDGAQNALTNISLTSSVTGVLPTANGGTGVNSSAIFPSSGTVGTVPSAGVVKSNGSTFSAGSVNLVSEVSGTLPISMGGTGQVTANAALNALLPAQAGNVNKVLKTDGTNASWVSPSTGQVQTYETTWTGLTVKTVTHGIGTVAVDVTVLDENNEVIYVEVTVDSVNQVTLTSSEAPSGAWTILIQGAP